MYLLRALLSRFVRVGTLDVTDADGIEHRFSGAPGIHVGFKLHDKKLHTSLFLNPELKAGEAYMDGSMTMTIGTVRDLITLFFINAENMRSHPFQRVLHTVQRSFKSLHQRNDPDAAKAHVHHHYDLSNDLYRAFLDTDMNYSCAYWAKDDDTLETAQQNKLRHIAAKLDLKPGQKVLDIGCGWGGMALFMAEHADVEVLGITLSEEQLALARSRARDRGLEHRVKFELIDYREFQGAFDRIVSIGMFEHVGVRYYDAYFAKMRDLLKPDGVALLHSIGRMGTPDTTSAWIRKYIFPGGYSPALSEVFPAIERSGLWCTDMEIWRLHYAKTLRVWEERFQANRPTISKMMDERFCRMWEFYLIGSELSFSHGDHLNFQIQMTKKVGSLPLTRDYMTLAERGMLTAVPR
jgi:cyclopropane-fatty-acyl-phospholipid synthase